MGTSLVDEDTAFVHFYGCDNVDCEFAWLYTAIDTSFVRSVCSKFCPV